ncbi:hypothetical protein KM043_016932 [Ampulex compressa]|nr:hypothetical protein KM043_016932 [Ampulex compressa]
MQKNSITVRSSVPRGRQSIQGLRGGSALAAVTEDASLWEVERGGGQRRMSRGVKGRAGRAMGEKEGWATSPVCLPQARPSLSIQQHQLVGRPCCHGATDFPAPSNTDDTL